VSDASPVERSRRRKRGRAKAYYYNLKSHEGRPFRVSKEGRVSSRIIRLDSSQEGERKNKKRDHGATDIRRKKGDFSLRGKEKADGTSEEGEI